MNTRISTLALLQAIVVLQIVVFLGSIYYCLYPFPFLDQLDWILGYMRDGFLSVFLPHHEHRLPIPRSLLILDLELFRGASVFVPLAGLLALAALAGSLIGEVRIYFSDVDAKAPMIVGSLAVLLLVRGYTIPDYVTPSIIQFILFLAFTALALSAATKSSGQGDSIKALAYGLAAAGCGASGLAVFPALAWISWRLWKNARRTLFFSGATILLALAYFHDVPLDTPSAIDPLHALKFMIEYFGVPWERLSMTYPLAFLQGALIIGLLSFLIAKKTLGDPPSPPEAFFLAFGCVLLATGLMTAFGRSSSVDLETQGSRYAVVAATSQAITLILLSRSLAPFIVRLHPRPLYVNLAVIVFSLLLLTEQALAAIMVHQRTEQMAELKKHVCSGQVSLKDLETLNFLDTDRAARFVEAIKPRNLYCGP